MSERIGIERKNQMIALRNKGYSLLEIGKEFSLTKQRVQQLLGKTGLVHGDYSRRRQYNATQDIISDPYAMPEAIAKKHRLTLDTVNRLMQGKLHAMRYSCRYILEDYTFAIEMLKAHDITSSYDGSKTARCLVTEKGIRIRVISRRRPEKVCHRYRINFRVPNPEEKIDYVAFHIISEGVFDKWVIMPTDVFVSKEMSFSYPSLNGIASRYTRGWDEIIEKEKSYVG